MNSEKSVSPRKILKAQKYSKGCQAVVRYPMDEWLIMFKLLCCLVILVDQPAILG
ncbi:MAG: hypothetical protein WC856_13480 [Methylococcaceae bacterium]|jgi:hypothetical protein